ncbi:14883_t:CDS:1 [Dentiscutata erythropus]|uniref:14883_t:CDS:1 n=1 Tax=Dentiscutata erythropus TaxID=1348616 RepID=A0A9N9DIQ1_9GLOM|nr:14883_t:CDS:1 [Dentiscutata erythropus]
MDNFDDDLDLLTDNLNYQDSTSQYDNLTIHINPFQIIRSGLKNTNAVDDAMNYLRIRSRFLLNKYSSSFDSHISLNFTSDPIKNYNLTSENSICLSNDCDNNLLKSLQATILS